MKRNFTESVIVDENRLTQVTLSGGGGRGGANCNSDNPPLAASTLVWVPVGSPSRGGDVKVYVYDINQLSLPTPFLFCSCVCFRLYGPFNCISFHKVSRQLSIFSLCSFKLISASLALSTICLFMKISFSPDIIPSG